MKRSQRIKTIVRVSENKERTAARQFAAVQKTLADFKERLSQLQSYREEYMGYLKPNGQKLTIKSIREQQAFILQIDEGIRMLTEQIQTQEKMNNHERDKWLRQKQQLDTMMKIFERFNNTEKQIVELREQHCLDEISQRQTANH